MIYIDLRFSDVRHANLKELLLALADKQTHRPASLGSLLAFLTDEAAKTSPASTKMAQLECAAQAGRPEVTLNGLTHDTAEIIKTKNDKIGHGRLLTERQVIEEKVQSFILTLSDYDRLGH